MSDCPHGYRNAVGCIDCQDIRIMQSHLDEAGRELADATEDVARLRALNAELVNALELTTRLPSGTDYSDEHNAAVSAAYRALTRAREQSDEGGPER